MSSRDYIERNAEFDDLLDACGETITVAGIEFWPADILANCDPIAYRCYLSDWESDHEDELYD